MIKSIGTEEEIEAHYSQRNIQQFFASRVQNKLLSQMCDTLFRVKLRALYDRTFLELDMEAILNESFKLFEDYAGKMSKSTARAAWTCFLEQTVLCYI